MMLVNNDSGGKGDCVDDGGNWWCIRSICRERRGERVRLKGDGILIFK